MLKILSKENSDIKFIRIINQMDNVQKIQEDEYSFPYHYIPQFSNTFSQAFNWSWGINYISSLEFILEKIDTYEFNSICDLGCGDGRLVKEISNRYQKKEIFGIDYSERAIKVAEALNPKLKFKRLNILEEDIPQKFDVVTLIEVLEHIPQNQIAGFAKKISAMQLSTNKLLITVPHKNKVLNPKHYQHFDKDSLYRIFAENYNCDNVTYFDQLNKIKKIIDKMLTNKMFILNSTSLRNHIYRYYKKKLFPAYEKNASRMLLELSKK